MGAVVWGRLAITPFPILAHQTGRADLRHPAFPTGFTAIPTALQSAAGFEAHRTRCIEGFVKEPSGPTPCHFVPAHALARRS
jgi:hypothetical protein